MSTKAEIKRKKELKKKINLIFRVVCAVGLIILGIVYCMGLENSDTGGNKKDYNVSNDPSKNESTSENKIVDSSRTTGTSKDNKNSSEDREEDQDNGFGLNQAETNESDGDIAKTDQNSDSGVIDKNAIPHFDSDGRVNINTATVSELCKLNGIGEKRAQDIIDYRNTYGEFKGIEDIMKVKGIKQGVFSKIKDDITVDKTK